MSENDFSKEIGLIIQSKSDWRGQKLAELRALILGASDEIVETVKWKMPSKPLGSPTWEANGIVCVADFLKNHVRLTFPKGALIPDPLNVFNARLESKASRAVDFGPDSETEGLVALVQQGIQINSF